MDVENDANNVNKKNDWSVSEIDIEKLSIQNDFIEKKGISFANNNYPHKQHTFYQRNHLLDRY
jgi:hypothetical protein